MHHRITLSLSACALPSCVRWLCAILKTAPTSRREAAHDNNLLLPHGRWVGLGQRAGAPPPDIRAISASIEKFVLIKISNTIVLQIKVSSGRMLRCEMRSPVGGLYVISEPNELAIGAALRWSLEL